MKFNQATLFSKLLAAILFVSLPFAGFYLGISYQKSIDKEEINQIIIQKDDETAKNEKNVNSEFNENLSSCVSVSNYSYQFYTLFKPGINEQEVKNTLAKVKAYNIVTRSNAYYFNLPDGQICAGLKSLKEMGISAEVVPWMPTGP